MVLVVALVTVWNFTVLRFSNQETVEWFSRWTVVTAAERHFDTKAEFTLGWSGMETIFCNEIVNWIMNFMPIM